VPVKQVKQAKVQILYLNFCASKAGKASKSSNTDAIVPVKQAKVQILTPRLKLDPTPADFLALLVQKYKY
jgi:hypothetical protein